MPSITLVYQPLLNCVYKVTLLDCWLLSVCLILVISDECTKSIFFSWGYFSMLRPVCHRVKQPFLGKHLCSKDGDTKIMFVCIFWKYGKNWSVFSLYLGKKLSEFGLWYRLFPLQTCCVITGNIKWMTGYDLAHSKLAEKGTACIWRCSYL